jgi:hypothetical protein
VRQYLDGLFADARGDQSYQAMLRETGQSFSNRLATSGVAAELGRDSDHDRAAGLLRDERCRSLSRIAGAMRRAASF